jgi:hypothetical protein
VTEDSDPDAIWKPGYTGGVGHESSAPESRSRRRGLVAVGVVILGAILGAILVTFAGRARTDPEPAVEADVERSLERVLERSRPRTLPPAGELIWSLNLTGTPDQQRVAGVAGSANTVVMMIGRPGTLVALETADGTIRWSTPAPGESLTSLAVIDNVAILGHVAGNGAEVVRGVDLDSGAVLWTRSLALGERFTAEVSALVWRGRTLTDRPPGVDRLDPRTGLVSNSVSGRDVRIGVASVQRYQKHLVEWFDPVDLRAIGSWRLPGVGVETHRPPGRLELLDADQGIVAVQFESKLLIAQLSHSGVEQLDLRWSMPGRLVERSPSGHRLAVSEGELESVVDLLTGEVLGRGRPLQAQRHRTTHHLADQGWLLRTPSGTVEARNAAGDLHWRRELPLEARVTLVEGGAVSIATGAGANGSASLEVSYWR